MKLIGSKQEKDIRAELLRLNERHKEIYIILYKALIAGGLPTENSIALQCIPDEGEYIYTVLIEGSYLVSVEIDRIDPTSRAIIKRIELKEYQRGLSKVNQIQLAVAQELIGKT